MRAVLDAPFDPDKRLVPVPIPIDSLLGSDGHEFCKGWRLDPVDGSHRAAHDNRRAWVAAHTGGVDPEGPEPTVRPVATFKGGEILFVIGFNEARDGWALKSMYPNPSLEG